MAEGGRGGFVPVSYTHLDVYKRQLPLRRREGAHRGIGGGPGEVALVQTAMAEPDAGTIPNEELDPGAPMIVKGVGAAVAGRTAQTCLLYTSRCV